MDKQDDQDLQEQHDADLEAENDINSNTNKFSKVAVPPQQKKIFLVLVVAVLAGISYYFFFGRTLSAEEAKEQKQQEIVAKKQELLSAADPVTKPIDALPVAAAPVKPLELPPLTEPKAPEPPPPPLPSSPAIPFAPGESGSKGGLPGPSVPRPNLELGSSKSSSADAKKLEARRKAGIMVFGGGGGAKFGADGEAKDGKEDKDKDKDMPEASKPGFLGFGNGGFDGPGLSRTAAEQVRATYMGDTDNLIAQGKMIHAVVESAINTDLPGTLRAIIDKDVYAESGKKILIPKGSRVIGDYESEIKDGQTRVAVNWSRLIRPDGIDISLRSKGTDSLGRAGMAGQLDNKFWTRMRNAFLVSYVIPYMAMELSGTKKDNITTSTSTGTGGTTTNTSAPSKAVQMKEASDKFRDIAEKAIESAFPIRPVITIDQGALVDIFVQRDIIFPDSVTASGG